MKRRIAIKRFSQGAIAAAGVSIVAGCQNSQNQTAADTNNLPTINWQMATSWPVSLDVIFGGAQVIADRVKAITNGKFIIEPRAGGEIAPPLEVLNVVSQGAVQAGHTASYYYIGKSPALAFGSALPFGLTAQQQNAWLYQGEGLKQLQQIYASKFNVIQFPAGNTGTQMGGWFRKEVNTVADLQGLKMRIPGLGGQVMAKLGVTVQTLPGGEVFQALQTGAIDAAEWVGPYDDEKLGLNQVAKFYYYPGWWEPGATLEVQVNLDEWNKLPPSYQAALETAAYESNMTMLARYDVLNSEALDRLSKAGVQIRPYSEEIIQAAQKASFALFDEFAVQDADFKTIYEQWKVFRQRIYTWHNLNEGAFTRYVYSQL